MRKARRAGGLLALGCTIGARQPGLMCVCLDTDTADGDLNPAPLAGFQWTALLHLKRVFGVGPNAISQLDLAGRDIRKQEFYSIRDWLAFVPVVDLKIDQVSRRSCPANNASIPYSLAQHAPATCQPPAAPCWRLVARC